MESKEGVLIMLTDLYRMNVQELRSRFVELFGFETNQKSVKTLRRRLAYRIQEAYYGGLTSEERNTLSRIADRDPKANLDSVQASPNLLQRGTRLSREWHGKVYEVIATGDGKYEYAGSLYRSLSAVAGVITGSKWSGRKFFGLSR